MKYIKFYRFLIITGLSLVSFCQCLTAQKTGENDAKKLALKNLVDSQHFVFEAQSVTPLRGNFRNLTSPYDVSVTRDSLVSYLPFFGRAYDAPVNSTASALDFTSTNFTYSVSPRKNNSWDIVVKFKDKSDVQQYSFTVFDNGSATLYVTSNSRDAISFNGYVSRK